MVVIFTSINPNWCSNKSKSHKKYLIDLGYALVEPLMASRTGKSLPRGESSRRVLREVQISSSNVSLHPPSSSRQADSNVTDKEEGGLKKRARCAYCPYKANGTRYANYCNECSKAICPKHSAPLKCTACL